MSVHSSENNSTKGNPDVNAENRHPESPRKPRNRLPRGEDVQSAPKIDESVGESFSYGDTSSSGDNSPRVRARGEQERPRRRTRDARVNPDSSDSSAVNLAPPDPQPAERENREVMPVERRERSATPAQRHRIPSDGFSNPVTPTSPIVSPVDARQEATPRNQRPLLSAITEQGTDLSNLWNSTEPAAERVPLPPGPYECLLSNCERVVSRNGTLGCTLTFRIHQGEYGGRCVFENLWFTERGMPYARRDLRKLGIERVEQLDQPLPRNLCCRVNLVLRTSDDGRQFNEVRSFEVLGRFNPEPDPFDHELTQIDHSPNPDVNDEGSDHDRV